MLISSNSATPIRAVRTLLVSRCLQFSYPACCLVTGAYTVEAEAAGEVIGERGKVCSPLCHSYKRTGWHTPPLVVSPTVTFDPMHLTTEKAPHSADQVSSVGFNSVPTSKKVDTKQTDKRRKIGA